MPLSPFFGAELPIPPSINHQYIPVPLYNARKQGRKSLILSEPARDWKQEVDLLLPQSTKIDQVILDRLRGNKPKHIYVPLAVEIELHFKYLWTRDVDGGIKITLDSVFGYLGLDDRLVCELVVNKYKAKDEPHMRIAVRLLTKGGR